MTVTVLLSDEHGSSALVNENLPLLLLACCDLNTCCPEAESFVPVRKLSCFNAFAIVGVWSPLKGLRRLFAWSSLRGRGAERARSVHRVTAQQCYFHENAHY